MKFLLLFLSLIAGEVFAQKTFEITGRIVDEQTRPIEGVNIRIQNPSVSAQTDEKGLYRLKINRFNAEYVLVFSRTGYVSQTIAIKRTSASEIVKNLVMKVDVTQLSTVVVSSNNGKQGNMSLINDGVIQNVPSVSGNFESILKTLPGVSSNNELSSQYSVRGGNFDENLVYVNDVEIFRPLLVRNGQQEGLSFINPELVSRAGFSAGGFEARYGDKLSSVLDIRYSRPDSTQVTASAGLLGLSTTFKVALKKSYFLLGFRQKTNQNILKTQPVSGFYQPRYYDFQGLYSIDINKQLNISAFADYNLSRFTLIPESRETTFGTVNQQFRLRVDYNGQEKDQYQSIAGAFTLTYRPSNRLWFKWLNSAFKNTEREEFDIEGRYIFDEAVESGEFENVRANRGIGSNYNYARNKLTASIYTTELRAYYQKGKSFWESGIKFQHDVIDDQLKEYELIDSAGYTLPNGGDDLVLSDVVNASNLVKTNRLTAFAQNTFSVTSDLTLSAGLRTNFNSFTREFFVSPRLSAVYRPMAIDWTLRFAAGSYNQPPFYRELRDFNGVLNRNAKSQRSIHLLAAADYQFRRSKSPMKFTSEFYFKKLNDLVPYKIENLRIRYFANQLAKGYAAGADFSINREFVSGLESSFRLSLMQTREDIIGDSYQQTDAAGNAVTIYPGYLKRPTDQKINFSVFFQDKLFNSPSYKVHLTALYGSALPVGPPQTQRYQDRFKIPAYRRVDIGFSKNFLEGGSQRKLGRLNRYFESLIAYAEVFNLLNIYNTVSYLWIKDVNNNQYAIPNYLTSRQLNIKIIAKIKN